MYLALLKIMNKMKQLSALLLTVLAFTANAEETIRIYAASSMTNAISELSNAFMQSHQVKVVTVFGGSSSLARQIERGAPADVFISANQKWVDYLVKQEAIDKSTVSEFASNSLVLITPKSSNSEFDVTSKKDWEKQLNGQRLAIGQPDSVPAGIYSKEALSEIGVWSSVSNRLASTKNVRVALVLVELGEAPLGIVYKTDALASDKVKIIHNFSETLHSKIAYPLAKVGSSKVAEEFIDYLTSDDAKKIIQRHGFQ